MIRPRSSRRAPLDLPRRLARCRSIERPLALAVALSLAGCGGGEAFEVTLSVDPAISSEADLASSLSDLTFVLDSDEGLYPAGSERVSGDVRVENADADPELELVTIVPVDDAHLPVVRIERGGLSATAVDLRVVGRSKQDGAPVADGEALGLAFSSAGRSESVPFNFRDALRPPRVARVYPEDGAEIQGCTLQVLTLVFSRPMDPASLTPESVMAGIQGVTTSAVTTASSGVVADVTFAPPLEGDGTRLAFDLRITPAARAEDGTPLDQAGSEEGDQAFDAVIHLECGPPPSFPCDLASCPWSCGGAKECLHLPQIECVEGVCAPVHCAAECPEGTVCEADRNTCVQDCRSGSALSACVAGACDPATGLCAE